MDQPDPTHLAFDDVVIDFAGHRVLRDGMRQPLEPKAFSVLALLAQAPGRVFTRDEILDAVWSHRHVTPGVLNRVMTLLRHALGEDAQTPRYLHTVHGIGYRFDLPAEPATELTPAAVDASESAAKTEHPAASLEAPASMSDNPLADEPRRRRAADLAASAPARWPWLLGPVALALVAFALVRWGGNAAPVPSSPPLAPAADAALPTLVVLPLKAIDESKGSRIIASGLSEELIGSLAQIEGLRVIARESTAIAAAESTDPAALAKRLGISHALEGSLQQVGQHLRIRLRLVDAGDGRALWAKDFDRDASEVLALQRDIAQAVAGSLTLRLGLGAAPNKSGDAEFLRRLLAARALAQRTDVPAEVSVDLAEVEFRSLLRERPDDARVRAGLAVALATRAFRRPEVGTALREESLQEAKLALRLDPALPEPHYLLAAEDCRRDRWEACLDGYTHVRTLSPSQLDSYVAHALALGRLGYLDRAEAIHRDAKARDPINKDIDFFLARILDTQGRHEEARHLLERAGPRGVYARWFNAMFRHDAEAALRHAEAYDAANASDNYGRLLKPSAILTARALADPAVWPQAIASMHEFERENPGRTAFGLVFAPDAPSHAAELIAELAEARRRSYSSYDLLLWTRDLAYLRQDQAFQAYLRNSGILAYWKKHGFPSQCRRHGHGAYCD